MYYIRFSRYYHFQRVIWLVLNIYIFGYIGVFMFVVFRAQIKVSMPAIAMLESKMNELVYSRISKFLCLSSQQILTFNYTLG